MVTKGKSHTRVDQKKRVLLGAKYKEYLQDRVVLALGDGPYIRVFSLENFDQVQERYSRLCDLSTEEGFRNVFFNPEMQEKLRQFFGTCVEVEVDEQYRVVVPPFLREEVNLEGELVVTATGSHLEIWPAREYYRRNLTRS